MLFLLIALWLDFDGPFSLLAFSVFIQKRVLSVHLLPFLLDYPSKLVFNVRVLVFEQNYLHPTIVVPSIVFKKLSTLKIYREHLLKVLFSIQFRKFSILELTAKAHPNSTLMTAVLNN